MWLRVFDGVFNCFLGFVYFPAAGDASAEMEWRGEMQVLRSDIGAIRSSNGSNSQICIAGDFNVQPASLGGGVDCRPARVAAVEELGSELGFSLLHPHFAGESRRPVWLRHRKR